MEVQSFEWSSLACVTRLFSMGIASTLSILSCFDCCCTSQERKGVCLHFLVPFSRGLLPRTFVTRGGGDAGRDHTAVRTMPCKNKRIADATALGGYKFQMLWSGVQKCGFVKRVIVLINEDTYHTIHCTIHPPHAIAYLSQKRSPQCKPVCQH